MEDRVALLEAEPRAIELWDDFHRRKQHRDEFDEMSHRARQERHTSCEKFRVFVLNRDCPKPVLVDLVVLRGAGSHFRREDFVIIIRSPVNQSTYPAESRRFPALSCSQNPASTVCRTS